MEPPLQVHTVLSQWIPPHERARAVSLTTSGMYLGSAASMWLLPSLGRMFGADRLLQLDGALGMAWLALWLIVGREIPHRYGQAWAAGMGRYGQVWAGMDCQGLLLIPWVQPWP